MFKGEERNHNTNRKFAGSYQIRGNLWKLQAKNRRNLNANLCKNPE
jgi:hypothetical protein